MSLVRNKRLLTTIAVAFAVAVIFLVILRSQRAGSSVPTGVKVAAAVPVTVAQAKSGDLDYYLNAIGTVTPLNTVTVVSRVSGQIMGVYFKEGQNVKAGQLLVQIEHARCDRVKGSFSIGRKMSDTIGANCSRTKRSLLDLVRIRYHGSAAYICDLRIALSRGRRG